MKEEGEWFQGFQEQFLMQHNADVFGVGSGGGTLVSPMIMFPPQAHVHGFNPTRDPHEPFIQPSSYANFFNRRNVNSLQFPYDDIGNSFVGTGQMGQRGSCPFGLEAELTKMTAQEIMDAKAVAASKSHSEAERRRRERINNHLAKLRTLLPSTTKTDKASLLAEVIQHVKELKRQTTLIADVSPIPTELNELSVDIDASDENGKFVIKASLCCDDRSDLLPQIIKTLKSLHLRTLKAEITTLGGRVKNVLFITDDSSSDEEEPQLHNQYNISSIQEALKAVMEKVCSESSSGSLKRQRTNNHNMNIVKHRSY